MRDAIEKLIDNDAQLFNGTDQQILSKESLLNIIEEYVNKLVPDIEIDSIRTVASMECPVSGYIIESEESRDQLNIWANFLERIKDES